MTSSGDNLSTAPLRLPAEFLFGAGSSAFQVEGPIARPATDWDALYKQHKSFVRSSYEGNWWVAPGAEDDLRALDALGLTAVKMSIEWARVQPTRDSWDLQALERYVEILSFAKSLNLKTMVVLQHITLPAWVSGAGGWESPETPRAFARYASRVAGRLGHLVDYWLTTNEPTVVSILGYVVGRWPPYVRSYSRAVRALRGQLTAASLASLEIKRRDSDRKVGIAHSIVWLAPDRSGSVRDRLLAAVGTTFKNMIVPLLSSSNNDFIGVNYYTGYRVRASVRTLRLDIPAGGLVPASVPGGLIIADADDHSAYGYPISPQYLSRALRRLGRLGKPLLVTENGIADPTDQKRAAYIRSHVGAIADAVRNGVDCRGYMYHSLVDGYEWTEGFSSRSRFGLVEVDALTGQRIVRGSAYDFSQLATSTRLAGRVA